MCFCLGLWDVLEITTSAKKKSFSGECGGAMAKTGALLKMHLFALDIDFLWILIERKTSEHHCKIKYSDKDTPIFLYWGLLWYLLASLESNDVLFYLWWSNREVFAVAW